MSLGRGVLAVPTLPVLLHILGQTTLAAPRCQHLSAAQVCFLPPGWSNYGISHQQMAVHLVVVEALRSFIRGSFISQGRAACLSGHREEKCGAGTDMLIGQEKAPHVHSFSICENSTCGHMCERLGNTVWPWAQRGGRSRSLGVGGQPASSPQVTLW